MIAFDTGPGNALMDDFIRARTGKPYDQDGSIAMHGQVNEALLEAWLSHHYFAQAAPKSLDRNDFDVSGAVDMKLEDGMATLCAFTAASIEKALHHLPAGPSCLYVSGGGRHNPALMKAIETRTGVKAISVDDLGWNGDALEAEGFAYLAVRSLLGLPLSLPGTTGVAEPMTGGIIHKARA
jgi:anhydro-N-acetylmuramic acid kinase